MIKKYNILYKSKIISKQCLLFEKNNFWKNIFEKVKKLADKGVSRVTQIPMLYVYPKKKKPMLYRKRNFTIFKWVNFKFFLPRHIGSFFSVF